MIPNSIGCTSDGQLIRLAMPSAKRLGIKVHILGQRTTSSVGTLLGTDMGPSSFTCIQNGDWGGEASLQEFFDNVGKGNPITTEWENVPAGALNTLESLGSIIRPNTSILSIIQDRKSEKELAEKAGGKPVNYKIISSLQELSDATSEFGESILKTRTSGYDGKGQWKITKETNVETLWNDTDIQKGIRNGGLILEKKVDLDFEASVIAGIGYVNIKYRYNTGVFYLYFSFYVYFSYTPNVYR